MFYSDGSWQKAQLCIKKNYKFRFMDALHPLLKLITQFE